MEREFFGERIEKAIARSGLSKAEIARRLGIAPSTVSGWLTARTLPEYETLGRLSKLLKAPVDYFIGLRESPDPDPPAPDEDGFRSVPLSPWKVAAGSPMAQWPEYDDGDRQVVKFSRKWLDRKFPLEHNRLRAFVIDKALGESMLPDVRPGALVLAHLFPYWDMRHWSPDRDDGSFYLIRPPDEDGLTVRVGTRTRNAFAFEPLNRLRRFPRWIFTAADEDVNLAEVVLGKIRWVGQELN